MSSKTRQQLEAWLKTIHISAGSRVLDIGGAQKGISGRIGNNISSDYKIMDLEQPHEAKEKVDYVHDINKRFNIPVGFELFDVVFCLEVMEYVYDPVTALDNIKRMLKQSGTLFISTAFLYPVHNPREQDYLRYTENGILKLLELNGFQVMDNTPRTAEHTNLLYAFHSMEGMRPAQNYNGHDVVGNLISAVKL